MVMVSRNKWRMDMVLEKQTAQANEHCYPKPVTFFIYFIYVSHKSTIKKIYMGYTDVYMSSLLYMWLYKLEVFSFLREISFILIKVVLRHNP